MNFFKQLLSETSDLSMTRFLSAICVLAALIISIVCIYRNQAADSVVGLVSVFLAAGFGGKVAQKFAENKSTGAEIKDEEK
jgi:hypothetical protein